ncbi:MAG: 3-phosphoshikimate 1-carboxyvinyltransferase [Clostridia bacterium]|nr:3-phosphoshikimate 1-carboxyvinyltransferase [Clostridia bacterium]
MDTHFCPGSLRGTAAAPASKSEAHRRLICAGLTDGTTELTRFTDSGDLLATARCLAALGARVERAGDTVRITGKAEKPALLPMYDCGESGSTLRFFVPIALVLTHGGIFRMGGRLGKRPMDVYKDLLVPGGVTWAMREGVDGTAELRVTGSMMPGHYELPGNVSSQFVSGLLFALPLLESASVLTVIPPVESASYIRMTLLALAESGIRIEEEAEGRWRIPGRQQYVARSGALHGDWSQAAVLLTAGAINGDVSVTGLNDKDGQGDRAILDCLKALGAKVTATKTKVRVQAAPLKGVHLDMRDMPDIAPIVALACAAAEGDSLLTGCGRLRLKESDRFASTIQILQHLGVDITAEDDSLHIRGGHPLKGNTVVDGMHDHRMIMLASAAALIADGPVTVTGTEALAKSWPDYLEVYRSLGGQAK